MAAEPSPGHRACRWKSQDLIPALSHPHSISWVRVAGSMGLAGKQREIRTDSDGGALNITLRSLSGSLLPWKSVDDRMGGGVDALEGFCSNLRGLWGISMGVILERSVGKSPSLEEHIRKHFY